MAYIGRPLNAGNLAVQSGTGDGSDTTPIATLNYATTTNGIAVYLDGVRQLAGTDYNVTNQTTLTFTTAPANGVGVDVYFLGLEVSIPTPADSSVSTAKLANNAVDETKLKDALIGDFTDATVTASDTFLYGDATDSGNTKRDTVQGILDLAGGGATTLIGTVTASDSSSLDFTGVTGHEVYLLVFNALVPASDGQTFFLQLGTGSTVWQTSGYKILNNKRLSSDGADDHLYSNNDSSGYSYMPLSGSTGNATGENFNGFLYCFNLGATTFKHFAGLTPSAQVGSNLQSGQPYGQFTTASAVTGLRIMVGSGNITSGKVRLYGLNNT